MGLYPDGRPGELFITMAKEGSTIGGLMDCFGTAVSMSLQYGVPLEVYVNKFSHTRFEPMGHTKNKDIRLANSLVDYIFRWLGITFIPGYREQFKGISSSPPGSPAGSAVDESETKPTAKKAGGPTNEPGSAATSSNEKQQTVQSGNNGSGNNGFGSNIAGNNGASTRPGIKTKASITVMNGVYSAPATESPAGGTALAHPPAKLETAGGSANEQYAKFQTDAPICDNCGLITVRCGNCYHCYNCGSSQGCS